MKQGDKVWVVYHYEILQGKVISGQPGGYLVETEIGKRYIREENCCDNEFSACVALEDEAEHLLRETALRKKNCADSCLLQDAFGLVKRKPWENNSI